MANLSRFANKCKSAVILLWNIFFIASNSLLFRERKEDHEARELCKEKDVKEENEKKNINIKILNKRLNIKLHLK